MDTDDAKPDAERKARPERKPRRPRRDPVLAYEPALCAEVVKIMGEGYSLTAFAGHIGVSRPTLDGWIAEYPEFKAAVQRGRAARTCLLEDQFLDGGTGAKVAAHVFALKNAAPEDWRDRPEAERAKAESVVVEVPGNGRDDGARARQGDPRRR